jgi:hypothetical protein
MCRNEKAHFDDISESLASRISPSSRPMMSLLLRISAPVRAVGAGMSMVRPLCAPDSTSRRATGSGTVVVVLDFFLEMVAVPAPCDALPLLVSVRSTPAEAAALVVLDALASGRFDSTGVDEAAALDNFFAMVELVPDGDNADAAAGLEPPATSVEILNILVALRTGVMASAIPADTGTPAESVDSGAAFRLEAVRVSTSGELSEGTVAVSSSSISTRDAGAADFPRFIGFVATAAEELSAT